MTLDELKAYFKDGARPHVNFQTLSGNIYTVHWEQTHYLEEEDACVVGWRVGGSPRLRRRWRYLCPANLKEAERIVRS